ncbi:Fibronectin type III domain protein [Natrialba magadii ATCC 43099]|uniref:Fibronectin type III domain protein n=1 Tax=Natrialba magadii (strain ATCC 43099 / DSM 3394 / CCM 3739 / CIP 104546 / IAM 13178 / JCM 8861 / NBRC 102185 / NCIMB 2190 / MS3) TaxID=547559 RepID=D3SUF0_NATMM|nr:hypothetical protein [Natrialba magadii]ADD05208.1 Fibronectin type III domain protein [Natrialba magadii ATCC 43099]ELY23244.1 fibronectin type III domain-containing protein [Natrialba magadii ATCC 43099]
MADFDLGPTESPPQTSVDFILDEPDPPSGLVAKPRVHIEISWDTEENAEEYNIYRALSSSTSLDDYEHIDTTSSTSYTDTGTSTGTTYHYRVTAVTSGVESDPSSNESAQTIEIESLSVSSVSDDTIQLSISASDPPDEFNIYRARSSGSSVSDYDIVGTTSSTQFSDGGRTNGREYFYRVSAVDHTGESDLSTEVDATTDLPAPTIGTITAGGREATVGWTINDDNDEGDIEVIDPDRSSVVDGLDPSTEEYTQTDLLDGEPYSYYVRRDTGDAVEESGVSDTVITDLPALEDFSVATVDGRFVTLEATDPSNNSSGYRLLLRKDGEDGFDQDGSDYDPVDEGETVTFETTELLDGQQYDATAETYTDHATARADE